ncbi:putative PPE-repeat protein (Cell mobility) [Candidatus Terasakiella magnetica]|uniref:Putative PPE-repeat protein (Cell mobility) n=1 Tax=Candidatus Terasakiella magnetica TaxID=1867952 RepID=A0A1C3RKP5_9PROT|nr:flagellar motor protein MotB [Candidatus Terasakiella magnetica]SCA57892.1 putative PPE-repeat protein (Cell mobility) [Candidatus Terasakiella magnetica]
MNRVRANFNGGDRPKSDAGRTITLFLSLYLLVLAFFILLVSISSMEEVKSKALMESLSSTFSSVLPPRMDLTAFNATTGEFLAADEFQRQVTGLFSTVIGVVKVDAIQPGRLMRIELDGDGLFELDQDVIREGQYGFMDRLVAALSANPPGLRFEMEFVVPTAWSSQQTLPTDQSLAIRRAGAFARDLLNRGAPPGSVSIGMKGSNDKTVEIWFHIRGRMENRIKFEESPLIKMPKKVEALPEKVIPAPVTLAPVQMDDGGVSAILPLAPEPLPQTIPESVPQETKPDGLLEITPPKLRLGVQQ